MEVNESEHTPGPGTNSSDRPIMISPEVLPSFIHAFLFGVIFTIVDAITIFGNILVIASVYRNRRLRTVTNWFVVSLALADLLVGLVVLPLAIKSELSGAWVLGGIMCDIWVSADVMLCTASILNLCCISLDRFFAITNPLVYVTKRSKRLALCMTGFVWILAFGITCPPILGWREANRGADVTSCFLTQSPGYVIYSALGSFYIPLLVMVFVYIRIFKVAYESEIRLKPYRQRHTSMKKNNSGKSDQYKALRRPSQRESESSSPLQENISHIRDTLGEKTVASIVCSIPMTDLTQSRLVSQNQSCSLTSLDRCVTADSERQGTPRFDLAITSDGAHGMLRSERAFSRQFQKTLSAVERTKRRERALLLRESKTAKTLAVVVGCFVLCWLPFFLMYVMEPFCTSCNFTPILKSVLTWLGYCNSGINPFIYAFYNKDFRGTFWKLTCGWFSKRSQKHNRNGAIRKTHL